MHGIFVPTVEIVSASFVAQLLVHLDTIVHTVNRYDVAKLLSFPIPHPLSPPLPPPPPPLPPPLPLTPPPAPSPPGLQRSMSILCGTRGRDGSPGRFAERLRGLQMRCQGCG